MSHYDTQLPDFIPVLSRGKHRNPRKGACFMEFASYLAGERWSDHPACTHPLLAALARHVNDCTSDAARGRLVGLVPSVVGLTSDDLHVDARIALRAARTGLPVVAEERQRVLAVSVLTCERVLAEMDGTPLHSLSDESRRVLADVPHAARWAKGFTHGIPASPKGFRRYAAPSMVRYAVEGIALSTWSDPDGLLHDLLVGAIDDCAALVSRPVEPTVSAVGVPAPLLEELHRPVQS